LGLVGSSETLGKAVGFVMSDGGSSSRELGSVGTVGLRAFGCLALMVLIGSSTAPAAKIAVREIPVGLIPLVRFGLAGLCLWPIVGRGGVLGRMIRQDGWRLLAAAALCVPINQAFFLNGARLAPASHIGLIYAACPLVVLALAALLGQERLAPERILGVAASVAGVALIALENVWRADASGRDVLRGDLLEVGAVLAWGAYLTVNKPLIARHGALPVLAGTFLVGSALDLPIALATAPGWPSMAGVSTGAWLGLAYLAVVVSIGGLAFQNLSMRSLDASQVATFGNVAPLLTVVWGYLLFDERISPIAAIGGGLVMVGIGWASRPARKPRAVAAIAEPSAV
jgi:drug/metabolite transporter (DMT)-like permease